MIINFFLFVFCSFLIITNIIYIKQNNEFMENTNNVALIFFQFNFIFKLSMFLLYLVYLILNLLNVHIHCGNKFLIYIFYFENTLNILIYLVKHFDKRILFLQISTYLVIYILKRISYHKYQSNLAPIVIEPVLQEEVPNFSVQEVNDDSEIIEEDLENQNWEEDEGYVNNGYSNNCYDDNDNYWNTEGL